MSYLGDDGLHTLPQSMQSRIRIDEACAPHWIWTGALGGHVQGKCSAYGVVRRTIRRRHRQELVHRVVYELLVGPIGELVVDHLCGEKLCCRPSHLEAVTLSENSRRAYHRGDATWTPIVRRLTITSHEFEEVALPFDDPDPYGFLT